MSVQEPAQLKRAVSVNVHTVDGTASETTWSILYTQYSLHSYAIILVIHYNNGRK